MSRNMIQSGKSDSVPTYRYVLMAVVNPGGKLETGHYTSYNRVRGMWFKFDDGNVTSATQREVWDSNVDGKYISTD
ncbi:hypothetical protein SeMB42_g06366 [Synchytrium endobioticum]|uniref:USP domain-containing protein n=2 Tax=Synchytrium endobioticum TaxID=286115 RepID=A0A507CLZ1_9FUNG|nr:hypothetical protein SeMB42_g06366 [Synchytrium endobioticum]